MKFLKKDTCKIINNNQPFLNFLRNCKSIETFDFENLFTSVPQDNIRSICASLYEHDIQCFNCKKGFWLNLVEFCIFSNFLFNGKRFYKQIKSIYLWEVLIVVPLQILISINMKIKFVMLTLLFPDILMIS